MKEKTGIGVEVDIETRRKKQQALLVQLVERQVRSRAQQLYEDRGQEDGQDLQDWFQAESEVLDNNVIAPLYRKLRMGAANSFERSNSELTVQESV